MRFLFRMGAKGLRDQPLFERFEETLRAMGIVLEMDSTGDGSEETRAQHTSSLGVDPPPPTGEALDRSMPPAEDSTQHRTRRRRASFNSMYDVGEDATTQKSVHRPSSRSSMSRLEIGKPDFPEPHEDIADKRAAAKRERASSQLDRNQLLAQFLEMGRRLMDGLDPLAQPTKPQEIPGNGDHVPSVSMPPTTSGQLTSSSSRGSYRRSISNMSSDSEESLFDAERQRTIVDVNVADTMPPKPSLADMLRDASTFATYRRRMTARRILMKWLEKAVRSQQSHRDMEALAVNRDRVTLLRQALDVWRAQLQKKRQNIHTERFFKHLERRAARARDLYLMTKAFTHWAQVTSERVARTAAARQHILLLKYFNAWREITAVNELKVHRLNAKRPLDAWRRRLRRTRDDEATADAVLAANLKRRYLLCWRWALCYSRWAPEYSDYRLVRRSLLCWIRALRTQREREHETEQQYRRGLVQDAFQKLLAKSRLVAAAQTEADSRYRNKLLAAHFESWRIEARLAPPAAQVAKKVDRRILKTAFAHWRLRFEAMQQAKEFDRLRVMRNAWTNWNDQLRCNALNARIEERLKMEAMYKWILAERCRLAQRVRDQRIQRDTFAIFISTAREMSRELMQREDEYVSRRDRDLVRSALHVWREKLALQRRREFAASEFYSPRVTRDALVVWSAKHQHVRKLERWASDARYYFLMSRVIKQWRRATANAAKKRRQDAYQVVRRKIKMNLATNALGVWRAKVQHVAELEQQADQMRRERLRAVAAGAFTQWHEQATKKLQDIQDADVYYHRQLAYDSLARWTEALSQVRALEEQAYRIDLARVTEAASAQLRKLSLRIFQVRSSIETADAMRERVLRRHFRRLFHHWLEKARAQRDARDSPGPAFFTSTTPLPTVPEETSLEPTTPGPAQFEPTLNVSELMTAPRNQNEMVSTTPTTTPAYLLSPSKRAARARSLAQMSYTPATPLYSPFPGRLRGFSSASRPLSSRIQSSRRPSLGTMVRFAVEEPESPSEARRSKRD